MFNEGEEEGLSRVADQLNDLEKAMLRLSGLATDRGMPQAMMERSLTGYRGDKLTVNEINAQGEQAVNHLLQEGLIETAEPVQQSINIWYKLTHKGELVKTALPIENSEQI